MLCAAQLGFVRHAILKTPAKQTAPLESRALLAVGWTRQSSDVSAVYGTPLGALMGFLLLAPDDQITALAWSQVYNNILGEYCKYTIQNLTKWIYDGKTHLQSATSISFDELILVLGRKIKHENHNPCYVF